MGEIAEMLLDGTMCESCGQYIGDEVGYARSCCDENHPNYLSEMDNESDEITISEVEDSLNTAIYHVRFCWVAFDSFSLSKKAAAAKKIAEELEKILKNIKD